jgi:CheY-like chemotaxis protein
MTRKYGGSGLGLAITKALVDRMQGSIDVQSTPDNGATFLVRIPFRIDHQTYSPRLSVIPSSATSFGDHAGHILLVEDHPANVLVVQTLLEQYGYRCDIAESGVEALGKIMENGTRYDAILMDIQMRDMDGYQATERIREREAHLALPHVPIIAMTAHAMVADRDRCFAVGMDDYIAKPFNPLELKAKLELFCSGVSSE